MIGELMIGALWLLAPFIVFMTLFMLVAFGLEVFLPTERRLSENVVNSAVAGWILACVIASIYVVLLFVWQI